MLVPPKTSKTAKSVCVFVLWTENPKPLPQSQELLNIEKFIFCLLLDETKKRKRYLDKNLSDQGPFPSHRVRQQICRAPSCETAVKTRRKMVPWPTLYFVSQHRASCHARSEINVFNALYLN